MHVAPYNMADGLKVCENLREDDWREIKASRGREITPSQLARECSYCRDKVIIAYQGFDPIAIMGALEVRPGVYSGFMFATDEFPVIGLSFTKWARRVYFPSLRQAGAHRVEAHSIADHPTAHAWIEAIGAKREALVPRFGAGKEDFVRFAFLWDEDEHV